VTIKHEIHNDVHLLRKILSKCYVLNAGNYLYRALWLGCLERPDSMLCSSIRKIRSIKNSNMHVFLKLVFVD
jgi:hypothetical protein